MPAGAMNASAAESATRDGMDAVRKGDMALALACFRRAALSAPRDPLALRRFGASLSQTGANGEAIGVLMDALALSPTDQVTARLLGRVAEKAVESDGGLAPATPPSAEMLLAVLVQGSLDLQPFAPLCAEYLKTRSALAPAVTVAAGEGAAWLLSAPGGAALGDPVLLAYLSGLISMDADVEALLTALRRRIVLDNRAAVPAAFLAALARQCRNNEYVFFEQDDETAAVDALGMRLEAALRDGRGVGDDVLAFALYRPLASLEGHERLGRDAPIRDPDAARFVREDIDAATEQAAIMAALPVLTPLAGAVTGTVARHYEERPYPRWLSLTPCDVGTRLPLGRDELRERGCDILVAGCGTGRQAIAAATLFGPRARILAIDLSRASLAYAERMTRRYGLGNIRYAVADILALDRLDMRFDVIECTGVLHHLSDPLKGWRILASLLAPDGIMWTGLYSSRARTKINRWRASAAERGIGLSDAAIRRFRHEMMAGARTTNTIELTADLFSLSGIRDLIFHQQEAQFTIREIGECLDRLGLEFAGFDLPAEKVRQVFAGSRSDPRDLAAWEDIEDRNPELFLGMYNFWCRKPR